MIVLVVLFASLSFVASKLLGPKRPTSAKEAPYECGIVPEYEPAERFPVKFYLVAMAFIVLDVEIIFLYPFTTVFRELGALRPRHHGRVPARAARAVRLPPVHRRARLGPGEAGRRRASGTTILRAVGVPGRDGLDPPQVARARGTPRPEGRVDGPRGGPRTTSSPVASRTSSTGRAATRCWPATFGLACCAIEMMGDGRRALRPRRASAWRSSAPARARPTS